MKITIINILLLTSLIGISQGIPNKSSQTKSFKYEAFGDVWEQIDTSNGDTIRFCSKSDRYIKKSKEGILLIDGHKWGGMGTLCGCGPSPHGYWIERYRNGELKEQGRYSCNRKIGTWVYYYENGRLSKIESFKEPYLEMMTRQESDWDILKTYLLKEGPYLEYYLNGQLKVEGTYEIVEEFSKTDTLFTYDPDSYNEIKQIIEGEFWIPRSKKSRVWNTYSENGEILLHEIHKIDWTDNKIRSIENRYWEMFEKIFKKEDKE